MHFDPRRRQRPALAAGERAQAGQQLPEIERLGQVVVGAGVESLHARLDGVSRRQHENRHVGPGGANLAADRQAVAQRQHHVQHDGVVVVLKTLLRRRDAVARDVHRVGRLAQPLRDEAGSVRLVFDQQDPHASTIIP